MTEAPDLASPIVGWRIWSVGVDGSGPALVSPAYSFTWPSRRATTATCAHGCVSAPGWECHCGLYAVAHVVRLLPILRIRAAVLGCTALWGRVIEATDGWRGEHSYPVVLFSLAPDAGDEPLRSAAMTRLTALRRVAAGCFSAPDEAVLRALGDRYAVPVHALPAGAVSVLARDEEALALTAVVRDQASRGLSSRRLGDRDAEERFRRSVDDLLALVAARDGR